MRKDVGCIEHVGLLIIALDLLEQVDELVLVHRLDQLGVGLKHIICLLFEILNSVLMSATCFQLELVHLLLQTLVLVGEVSNHNLK